MDRIQPTGNATFDAVEVTAYGNYQEQLRLRSSGDNAVTQAEIRYLFACWDSARRFFDKSQPWATPTHIASSTTPLGHLTRNLATMLSDRGFLFTGYGQAGFWIALSAVVASGGSTNMAAVGDVLTLTTGATVSGAYRTAPTFTVSAVDAGPLPTAVTILTPGFAFIQPTGAVSTTVVPNNYSDATLTVTWRYMPTHFVHN